MGQVCMRWEEDGRQGWGNYRWRWLACRASCHGGPRSWPGSLTFTIIWPAAEEDNRDWWSSMRAFYSGTRLFYFRCQLHRQEAANRLLPHFKKNNNKNNKTKAFLDGKSLAEVKSPLESCEICGVGTPWAEGWRDLEVNRRKRELFLELDNLQDIWGRNVAWNFPPPPPPPHTPFLLPDPGSQQPSFFFSWSWHGEAGQRCFQFRKIKKSITLPWLKNQFPGYNRGLGRSWKG